MGDNKIKPIIMPAKKTNAFENRWPNMVEIAEKAAAIEAAYPSSIRFHKTVHFEKKKGGIFLSFKETSDTSISAFITAEVVKPEGIRRVTIETHIKDFSELLLFKDGTKLFVFNNLEPKYIGENSLFAEPLPEHVKHFITIEEIGQTKMRFKVPKEKVWRLVEIITITLDPTRKAQLTKFARNHFMLPYPAFPVNYDTQGKVAGVYISRS